MPQENLRGDILFLGVQGFIQAVFLMFVFERKLSFQMLYFVINDNKILLQKRWDSAGIVIFKACLWWSPSWTSGR